MSKSKRRGRGDLLYYPRAREGVASHASSARPNQRGKDLIKEAESDQDKVGYSLSVPRSARRGPSLWSPRSSPKPPREVVISVEWQTFENSSR